MTNVSVAPLQFEHDRRQGSGPPYNSLEFAVRPGADYRVTPGMTHRVTIWNDGFEASHELGRAELHQIRLWINEVLADDR